MSENQYETIEETQGDFAEIVNEMKEVFETGSYKNELIRRVMSEQERLRKTYAVLMLLSPARLGEIREKVFVSKSTIYTHLYKLIELGVAKKISIMDLWNRKRLKKDEKKVMKKFKLWIKTMGKGQVQYFAAKTHYFMLTELGKNPLIANWVLKLEKNMKAS